MSSCENAAVQAGLEPEAHNPGARLRQAGQDRHPMGLLSANLAGGIGAGWLAEERAGQFERGGSHYPEHALFSLNAEAFLPPSPIYPSLPSPSISFHFHLRTTKSKNLFKSGNPETSVQGSLPQPACPFSLLACLPSERPRPHLAPEGLPLPWPAYFSQRQEARLALSSLHAKLEEKKLVNVGQWMLQRTDWSGGGRAGAPVAATGQEI